MAVSFRRLAWLVALGLAFAGGPHVQGQGSTFMGGMGRTNWINTPKQEETPEALPDVFSAVSLIDSALPRTNVRMRYDIASRFRRPTMAEYFQPKGGLPYAPGPPLPETNIDYQELRTTLEWAPDLWFSLFLESPTRWVNPDVNRNTWGEGDLNFGFKVAMFTDTRLLVTLQTRLSAPTASNSALGTEHFTIEPALLANWRPLDALQVEGELRYWVPLGGTDFAGDILRYGVGLSYGQQSGQEIWLMPVVELVGWSILDGKALAVTPGAFDIVNVGGRTIVEAAAGVRVGLGLNADFYVGYVRALTGTRWAEDMIRVEFRWNF